MSRETTQDEREIMRDMYDAEAMSANKIPHVAKMVAGYDTGSPGIIWTDAIWGMFPDAVQVHINQGYRSSAKITSTVIDVESGAWLPYQVPDLLASMEESGIERPTVYCSRATAALIPKLPKVYDLWLAWPSYEGTTAPELPGWNVVAVQYGYVGGFDISKVFDDVWPHKAVTTAVETEMINGQVSTESFVPFPAGSFKTIHLYRDFVSAIETSKVRLAFHLSGADFYVQEETLDTVEPRIINIPSPTVDAVTVSIVSGRTPIGFTLA